MKLHNKVRVHYECSLQLTESEMRALIAVTGYGFRSFLEVFYKAMGKHYLEPHEEALKAFFEKVQTEGVSQLKTIDRARDILGGKK